MWMVYTGHLWKHWGWWILLIYKHYFKDGFYQHLFPFLSYLMIVISSQLARVFEPRAFRASCSRSTVMDSPTAKSTPPCPWFLGAGGVPGGTAALKVTWRERGECYIMIITVPIPLFRAILRRSWIATSILYIYIYAVYVEYIYIYM